MLSSDKNCPLNRHDLLQHFSEWGAIWEVFFRNVVADKSNSIRVSSNAASILFYLNLNNFFIPLSDKKISYHWV